MTQVTRISDLWGGVADTGRFGAICVSDAAAPSLHNRKSSLQDLETCRVVLKVSACKPEAIVSISVDCSGLDWKIGTAGIQLDRGTAMVSGLSIPELDYRIAVIRDNIRRLVEQAAAQSGAGDEARTSDRIADQTRELEELLKQREDLKKGN